MIRNILLAFLLISNIPTTEAAIYKLDPDHTTVMFRVRHLVGHVTGQFEKFEGAFAYECSQREGPWKTSAQE